MPAVGAQPRAARLRCARCARSASRRGGLLGGAPARARRRVATIDSAGCGTRPRTSARAPRRRSRRPRTRAPPAAAPAATPAAASWDPCRASPDRRRRARRRSTRAITSRAASNPPSRNTAPNTASSASARIDGRVGAAALQLAFAQRRSRAEAERAARRARACRWLTRPARTRDSSPSGSLRKALVQRRARSTQLSTASPMNSSRSLCGAPKLRCVSAWRSSVGLAERVAERFAAARRAAHPGQRLRRQRASNSSSEARRCRPVAACFCHDSVATICVAFLGRPRGPAGVDRLDVVGATRRSNDRRGSSRDWPSSASSSSVCRAPSSR